MAADRDRVGELLAKVRPVHCHTCRVVTHYSDGTPGFDHAVWCVYATPHRFDGWDYNIDQKSDRCSRCGHKEGEHDGR